ncbi:MAG: ATP synthase F1 subunit epsilon [Desulfurella sp.]|jgi:F-type H+-transporting ATPase subunit epsilon|uniref:ATP synthase epsilon chain n=1 Tax=Desulfurella multipotens TaxID=79269 RepID=A0A1G6QJB3_9BACT|nr:MULTISPECIES: ATP synthase F1 subunit epsilon [Desulfurella]AHF96865.1 F0F1 ATP synthase subunit epsilon [Desulfurella acetivorans A63]PMP63006.1 MAG: ATP synthase F1 subunit epsilon [Desulfurella multipotens]PMP88425.1 MAG: ATP synthase F1 subunit epsilon [Desulfurella sp.]SDC92398.1 F-type H+-transporting ATPase subunit epsilon [Desulfurella multipotens]
MDKIHCSIVTPERIIASKEVDQVIAPGVSGEFGILANHMPFISILDIGTIKLLYENAQDKYVIGGGYLEFDNNTANILCDEVFTKDNITKEETLKMISKIESRLKEEKPNTPEYTSVYKELEKYKYVINILFEGEK